MAAHVSPGGLLVVEPWFHPEGWIDGLVMAESATTEDLAITRLSHSGARATSRTSTSTGRLDAGRPFTARARRAGDPSQRRASPVEHWIEPHRLALWSDDQYRDAFARAGLDVEHDRVGLIGRGLYVGHKPRH